MCHELGFNYAISAAKEENIDNLTLNALCRKCTGEEKKIFTCKKLPFDGCPANKTAFVLCSHTSKCMFAIISLLTVFNLITCKLYF